MTFISEKLIFIHIPRSAGTSVRVSLKKFTKEQIFPGIKNFSHQSFSQIININKTITHNRTSFAVVRNPYERFVSIYRFANRPFKLKKWFGSKAAEIANNIDTFEKFIELFSMPINLWQGKNHFTPQFEWVDGVECVFKIDEKDKLNFFLQEFGALEPIGHFNRQKNYSGNNKMYRDFYNQNTKKIISKHFKKDFDIFKYVF